MEKEKRQYIQSTLQCKSKRALKKIESGHNVKSSISGAF